MGTNRHLFVTIAVAGMAAISSQSGASVLSSSNEPALYVSKSKINIFSSESGSSTSLVETQTKSGWATRSSLDAGIDNIRAGSSQPNWTYVPRVRYDNARPDPLAVALGINGREDDSFDQDTAVVMMDRDHDWQRSNRFSGRQFTSGLAEWSTLSTDWNASRDTHGEPEWNSRNTQNSSYRAVSEFCPLDISKEFNSPKGCGRYSRSLLTVLRVMDSVINWIKSFWGGSRNTA